MLQIKNECGFRISDMWSAGKLEKVLQVCLEADMDRRVQGLGFFLIPLMSLNCNLFMSEQFSINNRVQAWCVFSIHAIVIASLLHESSSLRVGGWGSFRGSTRRICCTSQDLLHLFLFFCVRGIRTRKLQALREAQPPPPAVAAESCNRRET